MEKIIITRPEGKELETIKISLKYGFKPVIINAIKIKELDFKINPETFSTIVFLSETSAKIFLKKYKKIDDKKIICIGPKTSSFLRSMGFDVYLIPEKYDSISLGKELLKNLRNDEKILIVRSKRGTKDLYEILSKNFYVRELYVYDLLPPDNCEMEKFKKNLPDSIGVIFTSSLSVRNLLERIGEEYVEMLRKKYVISIGPMTYKTLKEYGIDSKYPERYTIDDCLILLKNIIG